ncbi:MAG: DUF3095 domain-containing protein [Burkholderiales bacterium]
MNAPASASANGAAFYTALPPFASFGEVVRDAHYRALPDDWWIGVTDVVGSTAAIGAGRYKAVNMAGASAVSAVMNALDGAAFPFVFGGDGATFAVWPDANAAVAAALARTARWVADDLGLELRAALAPLRAIRDAGHEVSVARFQASPDACYAMFAGGGVAWATAEMKAGRFAVPAAAPGARPDLSGLSCRWSPMHAANGAIVSLLVQPRAGVALTAVEPVISRVLQRVAALAREGDPVPGEGPGFEWPPAGLDLEARASRRAGAPLWRERAKLWIATLIAWTLDRTRWKLGSFDPTVYRHATARNADWRKFDDGLRLTIDCDPATLAAIEGDLRAGADAGLIDYGLHAQASALMTCIVPSVVRNDHIHFVDGADGGYARAAESLKARIAGQATKHPG